MEDWQLRNQLDEQMALMMQQEMRGQYIAGVIASLEMRVCQTCGGEFPAQPWEVALNHTDARVCTGIVRRKLEARIEALEQASRVGRAALEGDE